MLRARIVCRRRLNGGLYEGIYKALTITQIPYHLAILPLPSLFIKVSLRIIQLTY